MHFGGVFGDSEHSQTFPIGGFPIHGVGEGGRYDPQIVLESDAHSRHAVLRELMRSGEFVAGEIVAAKIGLDFTVNIYVVAFAGLVPRASGSSSSHRTATPASTILGSSWSANSNCLQPGNAAVQPKL